MMMTVQFKLPSILHFKVYIFFEGKTGLNNLTVFIKYSSKNFKNTLRKLFNNLYKIKAKY